MENDNDDYVERGELLALTSDIVSSHVSNNSVAMTDVPGLIEQVFLSLEKLGSPKAEPAAERPKPAVPVRRSVLPDYIVCLEDGKKLKMLKRHLRTAYDMTPDDYRERWGLPADYPMVAPNYAAQRRTLVSKNHHTTMKFFHCLIALWVVPTAWRTVAGITVWTIMLLPTRSIFSPYCSTR